MELESHVGVLLFKIWSKRNNLIECLLLNDSTDKKRHWSPFKCKVGGENSNAELALQETADYLAIPKREINLVSGFKKEIKYVAGTRLKHVTIYVAKVPPSTRVVASNLMGINFGWHGKSKAIEKAYYKSFADIIEAAFEFIASSIAVITHQQNQFRNRLDCPNFGSDDTLSKNGNSQVNELYKTRFCEKFRNSGDCPYGSRCRYAHDLEDLRARVSVNDLRIRSKGYSEECIRETTEGTQYVNIYYKTKLCEKFIANGICPYNHKCMFAHNESELRKASTSFSNKILSKESNFK